MCAAGLGTAHAEDANARLHTSNSLIPIFLTIRSFAGGVAVPTTASSKPATSAPAAGGFSWTKPVVPEPEPESGQVEANKGENPKTEAETKVSKEEAQQSSPTKAAETKSDTDKKPDNPKPSFPALAAFGAGGSAGFGATSGGASGFTFSGFANSSNTKPGGFGTGAGFGFGSGSGFAGSAAGTSASFSSFAAGGKAFGFGDVSSAGWAPKKKEDEEGEGEGGGEDEDAEKEVAVKKSDALVQLDEVATSTGEEGETTVFQVRAKLFMLGSPSDVKEAQDDGASPQKKTESPAKPAEEEKKEGDAGKKEESQWLVVGIGNLKINVPNSDTSDKSGRPRVIMRRQKTFQLCLNSYLFANMVCDRAGPKDIRFTGTKMGEDASDDKGALATFLVRVKEEDAAQELIEAINKHKNS